MTLWNASGVGICVPCVSFPRRVPPARLSRRGDLRAPERLARLSATGLSSFCPQRRHLLWARSGPDKVKFAAENRPVDVFSEFAQVSERPRKRTRNSGCFLAGLLGFVLFERRFSLRNRYANAAAQDRSRASWASIPTQCGFTSRRLSLVRAGCRKSCYRRFDDEHLLQFAIARCAFRAEILQNGLRKRCIAHRVKASGACDYATPAICALVLTSSPKS